jgi:cysteine synthase
MGGGGVHASLVPGSADAAQELGGHLAGLNAYLNEQHTPVETLTMDPSSNRGSEPGAGQMQQGDGQNQGQGESSESPSNRGSIPAEIGAVSSSGVSAAAGRTEPPLYVSPESGTRVSVMA